ncbi:helix-turn-helix domain-containing protein [Vibrio aestuarianus]|uniref:helix-turn-helix domain-containing protein n=1 Tax=Vibrio aestuarianus TaxID=28171 RepID=UPI001592FB25|nr:helix-turn-helix domain-containing protein [Vibrio aestuarianus]
MNRTKTIHSKEYCDFIQLLCAERKRLGLSQFEVANRIALTQSDISKIESCERRIDIFELKLLLTVYRVQHNEKLKHIVELFFELNV